jgi:hypothetical protein
MGFALSNQDTYESIQCGACGIVFYVPEHWQQTKRQDKSGFYCPNGHCRAYTKSTVEELREQLAAKQQALDAKQRALEFEQERAKSLDRRLKQEAGKHKALRTRVKAGVCPCCHRTFRQLHAHMKQRHPEYGVTIVEV